MAKTKKPMTQERLDAIMTAFTEASDGLLVWEFGGADSQEEYDLHKEAAEEVSELIKKMGERFYDREMARLEAAG